MSLALFVAVASSTSLGIALPELAADIGAGQIELGWIDTAYAVVFAAVLLPAGLAADRFGRRRVLAVGLLAFGAAQAVLGLSTSPALVIGLRALSALGAAAVFPTTLSALIDAYPEQRTRAVAIWAAVSSISASVGGLISGVLVDTLSWRAVPVFFGLLALVLVPPVLRFTPHRPDPRVVIDRLGSLFVLVGLGGLVLGIGRAGQVGPTDVTVAVPLALGVAGLVGFVLWELRSPAPMVPVRLFRRPALLAGTLLLLLVFSAFSAFTFLSPQYLQYVRDQSTLVSALALLPADVGLLAVTPALPWLVRRIGVRWVGTGGAACLGLALVLLAVAAPLTSFWPTACGLVLLGVGTALSITPATTLVVAGLPSDRVSIASALNYITRQAGTAATGALVSALLLVVYRDRLGPLLVGLPPEQAERASGGISEVVGLADELGPAGDALRAASEAAFVAGYQTALLVCALAAGVGAVLCALLAPSGLTDSRSADPEFGSSTYEPRADALSSSVEAPARGASSS